jgi:hypothetical protein
MMSRAVSHLGALRPESVGLSAAPLAGSRVASLAQEEDRDELIGGDFQPAA